eukprot:GHVH01007980.1.p2 GENE.GHVH01007980.1~~GHVH01007980.1.p2  ORF type:complete len:129 (-),score=23.16 GHVH01007980.1:42-428(-)
MSDVVMRQHVAKMVRYGYAKVRDQQHGRNFEIALDFSEESMNQSKRYSIEEENFEFGNVAEAQMFNSETIRRPSKQGIIPVKLYETLISLPEWRLLTWDDFKDALFELVNGGYIVNRGGVYQLEKSIS